MNPAVHENYPEFKAFTRKHRRFNHSEVAYLNQYGDRFSKDVQGRVCVFRYRHSDTTYSINYTQDGAVSSISSSNGWTWTRVDNEDFKGWVVRNYFERWQVREDECGRVIVDELGITCEAGADAPMGLPERP